MEESISLSQSSQNKSIHDARRHRIQRRLRNAHEETAKSAKITKASAHSLEIHTKQEAQETSVESLEAIQQAQRKITLSDLYYENQQTKCDHNARPSSSKFRIRADFSPFENELMLVLADREDTKQNRTQPPKRPMVGKTSVRNSTDDFIKCEELVIMDKGGMCPEGDEKGSAPQDVFADIPESQLVSVCKNTELEKHRTTNDSPAIVTQTPLEELKSHLTDADSPVPSSKAKSIVAAILADFSSQPLTQLEEEAVPIEPSPPMLQLRERPLRTYSRKRLFQVKQEPPDQPMSRPATQAALVSSDYSLLAKTKDQKEYGDLRASPALRESPVLHGSDSSEWVDELNTQEIPVLGLMGDSTTIEDNPLQHELIKSSPELNKSVEVLKNLANLSGFFFQTTQKPDPAILKPAPLPLSIQQTSSVSTDLSFYSPSRPSYTVAESVSIVEQIISSFARPTASPTPAPRDEPITMHPCSSPIRSTVPLLAAQDSDDDEGCGEQFSGFEPPAASQQYQDLKHAYRRLNEMAGENRIVGEEGAIDSDVEWFMDEDNELFLNFKTQEAMKGLERKEEYDQNNKNNLSGGLENMQLSEWLVEEDQKREETEATLPGTINTKCSPVRIHGYDEEVTHLEREVLELRKHPALVLPPYTEGNDFYGFPEIGFLASAPVTSSKLHDQFKDPSRSKVIMRDDETPSTSKEMLSKLQRKVQDGVDSIQEIQFSEWFFDEEVFPKAVMSVQTTSTVRSETTSKKKSKAISEDARKRARCLFNELQELDGAVDFEIQDKARTEDDNDVNLSGLQTASKKVITDQTEQRAQILEQLPLLAMEQQGTAKPLMRGFQTASHKEIAITHQAKERAAKILAELPELEELNKEPFKTNDKGEVMDFRTTSPKETNTDVKQRAARIMPEVPELPGLEQEGAIDTVLVGFQTASRKNIAISAKAKMQAETILAELPDLPIKSIAGENSKDRQGGSSVMGFQTASRKNIAISAKAKMQAESILAELPDLAIESIAGEDSKDRHGGSSVMGFQTASRKNIAISAKAKMQAESILAELPDLAIESIAGEDSKDRRGRSSVMGFQTASMKKIMITDEVKTKAENILAALPEVNAANHVNETAEAEIRAASIFVELNELSFEDVVSEKESKINTAVRFETASKKSIIISAEAERLAAAILQDLPMPAVEEGLSRVADREMNATESSFAGCIHTASKKGIEISKEAQGRAAGILAELPELPEFPKQGIEVGIPKETDALAAKTNGRSPKKTEHRESENIQKRKFPIIQTAINVDTPVQSPKRFQRFHSTGSIPRAPLNRIENELATPDTPLTTINRHADRMERRAKKRMLSLSKRKRSNETRSTDMKDDMPSTATAALTINCITGEDQETPIRASIGLTKPTTVGSPQTPSLTNFFASVQDSSTPNSRADFVPIDWGNSSNNNNDTERTNVSKGNIGIVNISYGSISYKKDPSTSERIGRLRMYGKSPPLAPMCLVTLGSESCRPSGLRHSK